MSITRELSTVDESELRRLYHDDGCKLYTLCKRFEIGPHRLRTILGITTAERVAETQDQVLQRALRPLKNGERREEATDRCHRWEPRTLRHLCRCICLDVFQVKARSHGLTLTEVFRSVEAAGMLVEGREYRVVCPQK